jgi:hypothetical protein
MRERKMPIIAKSPSCKEAYVFQICREMKLVHAGLAQDVAYWEALGEQEMAAVIKSDLIYSEGCLAYFESSEDMKGLYEMIMLCDTSPCWKHEAVIDLLEEVL